ncbi:MAG: VOC family protein [Mycobacterium sp.]
MSNYLYMSKQLHHVVMRSHSAKTFVAFLTDVVGMEVQFALRVPGEVLEATLGWPPSDGADVTMVGTGDAGLIEVLDVPEHLRDIAPEGLAALSFLTDEFDRTRDAAKTFASDVTAFDTGTPGVELFFCTMGGVPVEFMGGYAPEANSETSDATKD